ncbi:hypothetical protein C8Q74DRAFT_1441781 [Fomes fomentarius]|nr:hypothetical protein C8Q74DRAFT_1441781 [Fomes fomentarius]
MSDNSQTAQLVGEYTTLQLENYAEIAVLCLLAYEYVITFDREMKLFWKRSITGSSILFITNRTHYNQMFVSRVFSTLRAYALSSRTRGKWSISTLVLLSSLAPLVVNFVGMGYWSVVGTSHGCIITIPLSATIQNQVCLITSDLLVMCITWKATYKTSREIKVLGQGTSLSGILFRNGRLLLIARLGTLYFGFLMDLQEAHDAATHQHSHISSMSSLHFNDVIGSLGSSLPAPGETAEVQTAPLENDGEMEMERLDDGLINFVIFPSPIDTATYRGIRTDTVLGFLGLGSIFAVARRGKNTHTFELVVHTLHGHHEVDEVLRPIVVHANVVEDVREEARHQPVPAPLHRQAEEGADE